MLVLAACTLVTGAIFTSCNTPTQKVENAKENVIEAKNDLNTANKEYLAEIENYRKETTEMIAANEQIINEFNAKIEHDKKAVKADYKKKIAILEQKNADLKKKLDDYKEEGKDKWDIFKAEFNHDMNELGQALKDLTVKNTK